MNTSFLPYGKNQNDLFWFPGKTYKHDDVTFGRKSKPELQGHEEKHGMPVVTSMAPRPAGGSSSQPAPAGAAK